METTNNNGIISFVGSKSGLWKVLSMQTIAGQPMEIATNISIIKADLNTPLLENSNWILRAFISNLRYTSKDEKIDLNQRQKNGST